MKSYTDLEQSERLAKILPIESADMVYIKHSSSDNPTWEFNEDLPPMILGNIPISEMTVEVLPCWSVAALLDLLPPYLYEFDRGIDLNIYRNLNGKGWHCSYMPNCIENMKKDKFKLITNGDNLVDACYKMIVELKERNLI